MSASQAKDYQQFKANVFSFMINRESTELVPSKIKYEGEMKNGFSILNIHLNYVNNRDVPDNSAVFILPMNNFQMLCEVKCQLNKKYTKLDIHEVLGEQKKKIKETSQNVISLGYQYFKINIGTFPKGSKCDLDIKLNIISTNTNERTYQTVIPVSKSKPLGEDNFSFKIQYSGNMNVSNSILCGDKEKIEKVGYNFNINVLTINQYLSIPIIIETELANAIPHVKQSGMNDEYFTISVLPELTDKTPTNDFIFIVDCSGSMSGDPVRNVSNCLLNYLSTLNAGCKFNIIRFGSNYECFFKGGKLVDYNGGNLNQAKEFVTHLQADMGGANLYGPLVEAYKQSEQSIKEGKVVQIVTLTDGAIDDKDPVFKLFGKYSAIHHRDFLEYDYDYEDYRCQVLYITNHRDNLSEFELRNLFSRLSSINSCKILHEDKNKCYSVVTLSSYTEAKNFIRASLLMKINEKPIYVSFENEEIRYKYRQNYKYMVYKKIKDNMPLNTVLSEISQYQARALIHDSNLFNEWIKLSWNFQK